MFAVCSLRVSSAIRASKSSNYPSTRPSSSFSFPFSLSPHPPWFESAQERKRESGFQDYTWTREMGDIFFFSGDERARKSRLKASVSNFYRRWRRIFYGRGQCKIKKRRLHPSDSADNKGGYARYRRLTPRTPYAPLHRRTLAHHPGCETTIWLSLLLMKGEIYFGGRFSLDAFHSARYRHPFSSFSFYTSHPLQILRIFLFAGHDASVNLKWPPSDPFHSLEWKLNEIGSPRIEAGDQRCLSLSRIHPFVKMNEFSLPNVYRTLYNKQRNFLCIRRTRDHKNLWIFFFLFFFRSHVDLHLFKGSDLYEALQYL